MAIAGNKGEWSEIYTLFKLLGDGKVHAGDANLNKMDLYYPILNVIREEAYKYEYKLDITNQIVVVDEDGRTFARIPMQKFIEESRRLLSSIKNATGRSFDLPNTEIFMHQVGCSKLKADSFDKADIHIVIHDLRTNMTPVLGFSIKSQLGSASTLLNAGMTTNFTLKVIGVNLSEEDICEINSIHDHLPRMQELKKRGAYLIYNDVDHELFKNNLLFLDSQMPQFLAECLIEANKPDVSKNIKDIVPIIAKNNPFHYGGANVLTFYEHKMKVLLLDTALGMTPSREWSGRYDANGGYLVVKTDGEIVCYHFYDRNDVEDYLYYNTRFERASRERYHFGALYRGENNEVFLKLNLQIRFTK